MALTTEQKTNIIDTRGARITLATHIVSDIFNEYGLKDNDTLRCWLTERIAEDSLYDILNNEQRLYIVSLADKCAADIVCIMADTIDKDNFMSIVRGFGDIGSFIERVLDDYNISSDALFVTACDTASVIGYKDTLLIDDTMYVYDNGKEERVLVTADFTIGYHQNYTERNIKERIVKRLHHKWHTEIKSVVVTQNEDGAFSAKAIFFVPKTDVGQIHEMLLYRFGATSGKPWHRCYVDKFDIE